MIDVLEKEEELSRIFGALTGDAVEEAAAQLGVEVKVMKQMLACARSGWELEKHLMWKEWANDGTNDN